MEKQEHTISVSVMVMLQWALPDGAIARLGRGRNLQWRFHLMDSSLPVDWHPA